METVKIQEISWLQVEKPGFPGLVGIKRGRGPHVDDVLSDLPGFVDVQQVASLPDHGVQRQTFAEAERKGGTVVRKTGRQGDPEAGAGLAAPTW